jgi:DNA-binding transcriptional regulator YdaS (Cro superfamily)
MDQRPDEITTATAAALLGISPRRLRQLADEGRVLIHPRGYTTVVSAVQGYLRSIRADASRAPIDASAARGHEAKAALIRSATDRRRATMTDRGET